MRIKLKLLLQTVIALILFLTVLYFIPSVFEDNYEDKEAKKKYFNKGFPEFDSNEIILSDPDKILQNSHEKKEEALVNKDVLNFPILSRRSLGNYETTYSSRSGPGEYGEPVSLNSNEKQKAKAVIKEFGFNLVASDKISLNRLPKDLRHPECKHWVYPDQMVDVSVILVFHNEGWSTLMRTVHSVINMSPPEMLAEVVMIDDHSSKEHLGSKLTEYIKRWEGKVKLYRNNRREGLIRARIIGAQKSQAKQGRVLIYLDAHCECGYNWLPPLLIPIMKNRKVCTVPLVDSISGEKYTFEPQYGGDENSFARGAWDWSMTWKRIALNKKERDRRKHTTDPFRSPAMAGGLFAIERDYFFEIGLYDPGLEVWGGENFEISFKIWMTGGELLFIPCSRVGHIYRMKGWDGNPPPSYVPSNPSLRNYVRVVETWWDEYRDYFYATRPETMEIPYGDISEQVNWRKKHNSKSFKWFMEEIAYDVIEKFPLPAKNKLWGEIRNIGTNLCIDSMGHKNSDGEFEVGWCHKMAGNQLFRLNEANQLSQYDQCVCMHGRNGGLTQTHCDENQYNDWEYKEGKMLFVHSSSNKCLTANEDTKLVTLQVCNESDTMQQWKFNKVQAF